MMFVAVVRDDWAAGEWGRGIWKVRKRVGRAGGPGWGGNGRVEAGVGG